MLSAFALILLPAPQADSLASLEPATIQGRGVQYEAEVGRLRVPRVRSREDSGTIELTFVRMFSTADEPGPPVFFLPGGPGNAATPMAPSSVWSSFLELGDVVLMDPRGVGRSQPDLEWSSDDIHPELFFGDRESAVGHMAKMCKLAAGELAQKGVDLGGLSSIDMADDINALRECLEYEQIHLMGHSYGTMLGLSILRRHPNTVARFVSAGTAGPGDMMKLPSDLNRSLATLAKAVAADPRIGADMPDLAEDFASVVEDLEEDPLPVILRDPRTNKELEVLLGPFGFQLLVVADLGDTNDLPVIPRLIRSVQERNPSVVRWFLQKRVDQFTSLPIMTLAVRGAQGASPRRWKQIQKEAKKSPFGLARCLFSPESDAALDVADVGNAFRVAVKSDVPTLFISGTLDAATPPFQAERVRKGLPNSGHVILEYAGHEDLLPDRRVQEHILAFLAGGEPKDATLPGKPLRFALLEGGAGGVDHPALDHAQ